MRVRLESIDAPETKQGAEPARTGNFDPDWIKSGGLRRVLTDWTLADGFPIHAIYRRTPKLAPEISAFLNFASAAFAAFDPEELTLTLEKEFLT